MHKGWRRRERLYMRANLVKLMDLAIIKEGGPEILNLHDMRWHCFFRGLNPINMNNDELLFWLRMWLEISREIDKNSYSLLLHCPVLLGFNKLTNNLHFVKNDNSNTSK